MWRIAVVHHGSPASPALAKLRQGLQRRGLIEGDNCIVDAAGVEGRWAQLPGSIEQLLHREPDVLVAIGGVAALSARRATSRVPILYAIVLDPSEIDLTAPNVSGVTTFDPGQAMRHLRLLRQLVPDLRKLACLTDANAPKGRDGRNRLETQLMDAATAQGLELINAAMPQADADLTQVFDAIKQTPVQALVALEVPAVLSRLGPISRLAERHRLPMLSPHGWPDGGVVMQGAALHDAIDPLAEAIAALLAGAAVTALPLRMVRHERLVIHRGLARRIGLPLPARVLDQATQCLDDLPVVQFLATIIILTQGRGLMDITERVQEQIAASEISTGLANLFLRHNSASLLVQENADPAVRADLESFFARLVPDGDALLRHRDEGPDDMPAHVRTALTAVNLAVPIQGGTLALGTWQGIYVWEHRRQGHNREVMLHVLGER